MNENTMQITIKTPWHLWVVGILGVLWNASGALTITMAQLGMLPNISAEEAAYYAGQPLWFELITNIATYGSLFAGIALLCRSRFAFHLYGISLSMIVVSHLSDFAMGTSRVFTNTGTVVVSLLIFVIACLQLFYTWRMTKKGVLKGKIPG